MINYVNSNKGLALVSRRGTHVPLSEINFAEVKKLKNNCACIKIIDKKGESFYTDYRTNITDAYKVQRELEQSLVDLQNQILNINCIKYSINVNDKQYNSLYTVSVANDKVWSNSATISGNVASDLIDNAKVDLNYGVFRASENQCRGIMTTENPKQVLKQNNNHNLDIIGDIESYLI